MELTEIDAETAENISIHLDARQLVILSARDYSVLRDGYRGPGVLVNSVNANV